MLDDFASPPKERYAVSNNNVVQLIQPGAFKDQLTDIIRAQMQRPLRIRQPCSADTMDARGHIFEALGRREEAIADFRGALSIDPDLEA